ncbi:hypothetical protein G9A89_020748 [Geosiphon pyriformis]|nr:hypothetical protein G9A89_020748 [Geosiphon pyriformis]
MKKTAKVSGPNDGFKPVLPKKKRRNGALKDSFGGKVVGSEVQNSHLWGLETSDTTESDSIDMEEECLVEETSFRQKSRKESGGINTDMTPKGPKRIVTKCTLGKPLGTINFGMENDDDNNILDGLLSLPPSLSFKHMVQVSVRKSFALDINLGVVTDKLSQEKLAYTIMTVAKLANDHGVVINTNFKHPGNNYMNWAIVLKKIPVGTSVEAVRAVVSEFGVIKIIKMQLVDLWQKAIIELEDQN